MILVRGTLFVVAAMLAAMLALALAGCAPTVEYRAIPAWLVPAKPTAPTVRAADLRCLANETYLALAERDRACWRYASELRALLGPEAAP